MARVAERELVQILSGNVEVVEPDGTAQVFGTGQEFLVPMGTIRGWAASEEFGAYSVVLSDPARPPA